MKTTSAHCHASKVQSVDFAYSKLTKTLVVPVDEIEYDATKADADVVARLRSSIEVPWGKLLQPVLVSALPDGENKKWRLRNGVNRLMAAVELELPKISIVILEGTEQQIQLLAADSQIIRRSLNVYQEMENLANWFDLLKKAHEEYTAGGNQEAKNAIKTANGLPTLNQLIEAHSGLKRSSFFTKVKIYDAIEPTVMKPWLEANPSKLIVTKHTWLQRLSKHPHDVQNKLPAYLDKISDPTEAYYQWDREQKASKAAELPDNELFPIYHETFEENAKRIPDGTVNLIATDPNWQLAEEEEQGDFYLQHGIPIAPKLTAKELDLLGQLAAKKLHPEGHLVLLVGQRHANEFQNILQQYLRFRWTFFYIHGSGIGTAARIEGIASHGRLLQVYQHKEHPNPFGTYKQFTHDCIPNPSKLKKAGAFCHLNSNEVLREHLLYERQLIDERITALDTGSEDPYLPDLIVSSTYNAEQLKRFHPWAQDVGAWREIIRRFTKLGQLVWEPFAGSGTTAVAALTCKDRVLGEGEVIHPRIGIGCDAMEIWAKVAKYRVWQAQHGEMNTEPQQLESAAG